MPIEKARVEPAFLGNTLHRALFRNLFGGFGKERQPGRAETQVILGPQIRKMFLKAGQSARIVNQNVTPPQRPEQFARGGNEFLFVDLLKVPREIKHRLNRVPRSVGKIRLQRIDHRRVSDQADINIELPRKIRGETMFARDRAHGGVRVAIQQFTTNGGVKFQGVLAVSFYVLRE